MSAAYRGYDMTVRLGPGKPSIHAGARGFVLEPMNHTSARGVSLNDHRAIRDVPTIRQVLAGCIQAGWSRRKPEPRSADDLRRYIYALCISYHSTKVAWENFTRARDQLAKLGDDHAAEFMDQKAHEERGHDRLALRDLQSMGLPAAELVRGVVPPRAHVTRRLFDRLSRLSAPYAVFGYSYMLERMSLFTTQEVIDRTQMLSPNGKDITRCIRVHSAVGADVHHVRELIEHIAMMPAGAVLEVCRGAYLTSRTVHTDYDETPSLSRLDALLGNCGFAAQRHVAAQRPF